MTDRIHHRRDLTVLSINDYIGFVLRSPSAYFLSIGNVGGWMGVRGRTERTRDGGGGWRGEKTNTAPLWPFVLLSRPA